SLPPTLSLHDALPICARMPVTERIAHIEGAADGDEVEAEVLGLRRSLAATGKRVGRRARGIGRSRPGGRTAGVTTIAEVALRSVDRSVHVCTPCLDSHCHTTLRPSPDGPLL